MFLLKSDREVTLSSVYLSCLEVKQAMKPAMTRGEGGHQGPLARSSGCAHADKTLHSQTPGTSVGLRRILQEDRGNFLIKG